MEADIVQDAIWHSAREDGAITHLCKMTAATELSESRFINLGVTHNRHLIPLRSRTIGIYKNI